MPIMDSMHDDLLPLFPLAVVLLPHNRLPLHIFEDRYKDMIGRVMAESGEFGVVLAAGEGLVSNGCTATVEEVLQEYPDGRLDIMTLGRRRFSIEDVNADLEYLRARVSYFDDDDAASTKELRRRATFACRRLPSDASSQEDREMDFDSPQLSFQLARFVTDLEFRQQLLTMRSEPARLERLIEYAPGYVQHREQAERLKHVAGLNGHGKLPPGLVK